MSEMEKGTYEDKASAVTRDILVAFVSTINQPNLLADGIAERYAKALTLMYETIHPAVVKSLGGRK